jgi:FkbM family methyltransferase
MMWYDDAVFTRSLPLAYRWFAKYCAGYVDTATGEIPHGLWLFHWLNRMRRVLRLRTTVLARVGQTAVALDLCDPRAQLVYQEMRGLSPEARLLPSLLRPGDVFLDIGANHGGLTLIAARLVGPSGRVVAFEPQPHLAQQIASSCIANDFPHVRVINAGLSDACRRATLYVPRRNSGSASLFREYMRSDAHTTVEIELRRLDDLGLDIPDRRRLVVKMDMEGSERACLLGGARFFQQHLPDIILEINDDSAQAAGYTVGELIDLLRSYGYRRFSAVDDSASMLVSVDNQIVSTIDAADRNR